MKTSIRIVFVIFIANEIDCLGGVCDDCCDCFNCFNKKKDEFLVNTDWCKAKEDIILKIFTKEDDNVFTSKGNEDKISFKLDEKDNSKIDRQNGPKKLKLEDQKYALFEIKTQKEETIYLYCSDIESSVYDGIFKGKTHVSISVIACDTEKVTNMEHMFYNCKNLTKLEIGGNFNTKNVENMSCMFQFCNSLTELDLEKFNTENVTDMRCMFDECNSLKKLNIKYFNTKNVMHMNSMFSGCRNLTELDIRNFDTSNVTDMSGMFSFCSGLTELDIRNFNTSNVTNMSGMFSFCRGLKNLFINEFYTTKLTKKENIFYNCANLPPKIKYEILNEVI